MRPEVKTKWIEALRSGKYLQAIGRLRRARGRDGALAFCCLGVLCEVTDPTGWTCWGGTTGWIYQAVPPSAVTFSATSLPEEFRCFLGILPQDESLLVRMNDEELASFQEIADWIEVNL